jgi:hypothetical protein
MNAIFTVGWVVCGVLAVGIGLNLSKRLWPSLWESSYYWDLVFLSTLALSGPLALIFLSLISLRDTEGIGIRYRKVTSEDKVELVEMALDRAAMTSRATEEVPGEKFRR